MAKINVISSFVLLILVTALQLLYSQEQNIDYNASDYLDNAQEHALIALISRGKNDRILIHRPDNITLLTDEITPDIAQHAQKLGGLEPICPDLHRIKKKLNLPLLKKYEQKLPLLIRLPIENEPLVMCVYTMIEWLKNRKTMSYWLDDEIKKANNFALKNNRVSITENNRAHFIVLAQQLGMLLLAETIKNLKYYSYNELWFLEEIYKSNHN